MILDHKKRFKESQAHKPWHEAIGSEWFQFAIQTAMLELQRNIPPAQDMGAAAANAFRLQGAQLLVSTMMNLTTHTPAGKPPWDQNLDHNA